VNLFGSLGDYMVQESWEEIAKALGDKN